MKKLWVLSVLLLMLVCISACDSGFSTIVDLGNADKAVSEAAIEEVAQMNPPPVKDLVKIVFSSVVDHYGNEHVTQGMRESTAKALIKIGDPAVEPLLAYLKKTKETVPDEAIAALAGLKTEQMISGLTDLVQTVSEYDDERRRAAITALAMMGEPKASDVVYAEYIKRVVNRSKSDPLDEDTILAMGIIADERSTNELIKIITEEGYVQIGDSDIMKPHGAAFLALSMNPRNLKALTRLYDAYIDSPDFAQKDIAVQAEIQVQKLFNKDIEDIDRFCQGIDLGGPIDSSIKPGKMFVFVKNNPPIKDSNGKEQLLTTDVFKYLMVPPEYRCETPQEADTLAFICSILEHVGMYTDGHSAYETTSYLVVVDVKTKKVIAVSDQYTRQPPHEKNIGWDAYGDIASEDISKYIKTLYGKS